jgi:hypothetical protein
MPCGYVGGTHCESYGTIAKISKASRAWTAEHDSRWSGILIGSSGSNVCELPSRIPGDVNCFRGAPLHIERDGIEKIGS